MRLGDLDDLKIHISELMLVYSGTELDNAILNAIDNVPTVEPTYISDMPDDKVKDLQELAIDYGEGIAVFERKRPQGEWKYTHDTFSKRICNKCNYLQVIVDGMADNFCPNCGAKMNRTEK